MASHDRPRFVELEFSLADDAYPAMRISERLDCGLELLDVVPTDAGTTTAFFHVESPDSDGIVEAGNQSEFGETVGVVQRFDDACVVEIVRSRSVFDILADAKIPLQSLVVTGGTAHWVATLPPARSPEDVVSTVKTRYPSIELVGKRQTAIAAPFVTRLAFQAMLDDRLTSRQLEALRAAFERGYFERPRKITQRELADRMGISPSTFGQHLHTALQKLLASLFTD